MSNFLRSLVSKGTSSRSSYFTLALMAAGTAFTVTVPTLLREDKEATLLRLSNARKVVGLSQMTLFT